MQEIYQIIGVFFAIQVTIYSQVFANELGSTCADDSDCNVENSRCYQKQCSCLPFFAEYNGTTCLPSNMLGFECIISEQCSKKVANSNCIGGICRCEPGYLQYRRHTCLTAAKIGDVCYSNSHCTLWDGGSHCDFLIPNLFGRCICNAPLKQSRSGTCQPNAPPPSTSTAPSLDFPYPVITKIEAETSNKTSSITTTNNKSHIPQKVPGKVKPDLKPTNKTDKLDPTVSKIKPSKPMETESKPPNRLETKPSKPEKPLPKPEKPVKKPDQKFPLNQLLNKTHQQLEYLGDKIASFYQAAANAKPHKPSPSTLKPVKTSTTEKVKITSTPGKPPQASTPKSVASTSSNFFSLQQPSKPNKQTHQQPVKADTGVKYPEIRPQAADKILVVNNQLKKPAKNKHSGLNKAGGVKNPFQDPSSPSSNKENLTAFEESSLLRYPSTVNKQMESMVAESSQKGFTTNESLSWPLHHRGTEELTSVISLGYGCKMDSQCMRNDNNSRCINGVCDCVARRTRLKSTCSARHRGCHKGTFQCKSSGHCISWFFVCDGRKDCSDGSDEDCKDKNTCPEHTFRCGSTVPAVCISQASRCDGNADCPSGEDEFNCTATKHRGCPLHTFQCEDGRCLPEYEFCNAVISCEDGSDEPDNSCTATWKTSVRNLQYCPFRCTNGRCRSSAVVCSGRDGCGDNSDENKCSVCKCPAAA